MKKKIVYAALFVLASFFTISCNKETGGPHDENQTMNYSSETVLRWMDLQLELFSTHPTPIGGLASVRIMAYSGIATYESVLPGMPGYQSLSGQLTDIPDMPETELQKVYHWPACANAALAYMNLNFFSARSQEDKNKITGLESELNNKFTQQDGVSSELLMRSAAFGQEVAKRIFEWSKGDDDAYPAVPYTVPTGLGKWIPTSPPPAIPAGSYFGYNRLFVPGSLDGSALPNPAAYSESAGSDFYNMAKEVYDISKKPLTDEEKAIANYYKDSPGFGSGHYLSILKQVLLLKKASLDITALLYAKTGIAIVDASIACFKAKYDESHGLVVRPVTYIKKVFEASWAPFIGTPNHPEYPSGHSTQAGAIAEVLTQIYGDNFQFTNHTYDYLNYAPRTYSSFNQMAEEIGDSRVFGGIHYRLACTEGKKLGVKVAKNIESKLRFRKH